MILTCVPGAGGGGGEGSSGRDEEEQEAQKDRNGGVGPVTFPERTSGNQRQMLAKAAPACPIIRGQQRCQLWPEKCPLLEQGGPAGHKAGLSGEPQQGHQDEEDASHHLGIAGAFRKHRTVVKARLRGRFNARSSKREDAPDGSQFGILLMDPPL